MPFSATVSARVGLILSDENGAITRYNRPNGHPRDHSPAATACLAFVISFGGGSLASEALQAKTFPSCLMDGGRTRVPAGPSPWGTACSPVSPGASGPRCLLCCEAQTCRSRGSGLRRHLGVMRSCLSRLRLLRKGLAYFHSGLTLYPAGPRGHSATRHARGEGRPTAALCLWFRGS